MNKQANNSSNTGAETAMQIATPTIDFSGKTKTKVNCNLVEEKVITEEELLQFLWQFQEDNKRWVKVINQIL